MPSPAVQTLSALFIALAWADGEVTADELNLLKDMTFRLPTLSGADWEQLNMYWLAPLGHKERERLATQLLNQLQTPSERQAVKDFLYHMAGADGQISPQEQHLLYELDGLIERREPALIQGLARLLSLAQPKAEQGVGKGLDGFRYVEGAYRQRLKEVYGVDFRGELGLNDEEIRRLALAGLLMGVVAYADHHISQEEIKSIQRLLEREWSLEPRHAAVIALFAADSARAQAHLVRLTRQFYEISTYGERLELLEVLLAVAKAQDGVSKLEVSTVRHIGHLLKLDPQDLEGVLAHA
jgi:uncharacterized tellurite resistance protein B-like protein